MDISNYYKFFSMNAKRKLVSVILLFVMYISTAQNNFTGNTPVDNIDCEAKFEKAKKLYSNMYNSPSAVSYREARKNFFNKAHNTGQFQDKEALSCKENILFWIRANIEKTDFSNFEEAQKEWENKDKIRTLSIIENPEFYKFMNEIKDSCGKESKKLFMDLIKEYGSEFYM